MASTAKALQATVNHGAPSLKRKVARAIIDHITQTLPGPNNEGYLAPLLEDYVKALLALLRHPANVEQLCALDGEGWLTCVDFLVNAVSALEGSDGDQGTVPRASPMLGSAPSLALTYSGGRSGTPSTQRSLTQISTKTLERLVQGLFFLVSSPNAPIQRRAAEISKAMIQTLQMRQLSATQLQQTAFSTLGCVVAHVQGDNLALAGNIASDIMPLLSHWWQPRTSGAQSESLHSFRDEILRLVFGLQLHIESIVKRRPGDVILGHIQDTLDALWMEYSKREDRLRLQLGDITFSRISTEYFNNEVFGLRPYDADNERKWAVVEIIALLESVWVRSSAHAERQSLGEEEQPRKRRRIEDDPNRLRERLRSPDVATKFTALQVLPFFIQRHKPSLEDISSTLADLMGLIGNRHTGIASWAMLACAR